MIAIPDSSLLIAETGRRWKSLDPLLPDATVVCARGYDDFLTGPGQTGGIASRTHSLAAIDFGSLWREPCTITLLPVISDGSPDELDELLRWWRETSVQQPGHHMPIDAAYLWLPSRETWAVPILHRHRFQPHTVLAVRRQSEWNPPPSLSSDELDIQDATVEDAEDIISLWREVIAYDARIGVCYDHDRTSALLRRATLDLLARPERAMWMAKLRGVPVGLCIVEMPEYCGAISMYVRQQDPVYISAFGIRGSQRDKGIGRHLLTHVHELLTASGHTTSLLHHAVMNPLGAPFWARSRYRPLWAVWRLPARELHEQRMA